MCRPTSAVRVGDQRRQQRGAQVLRQGSDQVSKQSHSYGNIIGDKYFNSLEMIHYSL